MEAVKYTPNCNWHANIQLNITHLGTNPEMHRYKVFQGAEQDVFTCVQHTTNF
jgi:hypothetical protein